MYSTRLSSPRSFCALYLLAGNAFGATRSNVWPREFVTETFATETGTSQLFRT